MIRGSYWGGAWGLSWGGAWGEAWQLLNQPYQELSLKGQIFVRSYLTSIHSVEVAEQIVSVAALNNISVIDAEVAVVAKQTELQVWVMKIADRTCNSKREVQTVKQVDAASKPTSPVETALTIAAKKRVSEMCVVSSVERSISTGRIVNLHLSTNKQCLLVKKEEPKWQP